MIYKYLNTLVANYLQEMINFIKTIRKFVKCSVVVVVVVVAPGFESPSAHRQFNVSLPVLSPFLYLCLEDSHQVHDVLTVIFDCDVFVLLFKDKLKHVLMCNKLSLC